MAVSTPKTPTRRPSSMSDEEYLRISREADRYYDAGDEEKGDEFLALLPIDPEMAVYVLRTFGEEALERFNVKDADLYYGPDWVERFRR